MISLDTNILIQQGVAAARGYPVSKKGRDDFNSEKRMTFSHMKTFNMNGGGHRASIITH